MSTEKPPTAVYLLFSAQFIISILIVLGGIRIWSSFGLPLLRAARVTGHCLTLAESCP